MDAIEELFHAAREFQGVDRASFLDHECGADGALRRKVEALLRGDETAEGILNTAALDMVAATLAAGTVLGPYEVLGVAGAGAMGQVYRARDRRLNRDVAIKALPVELAHDPERLARLQREATLLASVNHPNVAAIYDVVEFTNAAPFLILEFAEGSTLAEWLDKGPLPIDETLRIAHQIAMALEAAHDKGIVHRDLKPANIKLTPDGKVKVLDFGLAKALTGDVTEARFLKSGSLSNFVDEYSAFAGTPSYMSPEQTRGIPVDQRADLWAFGCVVYELLTRRKAFEGKTVSSTVVSILECEPDWTLLPAGTPPALRRLLQHCLQKNVNERLQHASDLHHQIAALLDLAQAGRPARTHRFWAVILAVPVTVVLVAALMSWNSRQLGDLRVDQARQVTFQPELELDPAISPDGMWLTYEFRTENRTDIYVRPLAGGEATNVTQDLASIAHVWPRWSPDGSQLAFLAAPAELRQAGMESTEYTIYTVRFPGAMPRPITNASIRGLAWSPDGTKLAFVRDREIYVISLDGGTPTKIAEAFEANAPSWSPDGKWIAYAAGNTTALFSPNALGNLAPSSIAIVAADGGTPRRLTDAQKANMSPVWMPDSRSLLFVSNRGGSRDVFQLKLSDSGEPLGEPLRITTGLNALTIHLSKDGRHLVYSLFLNRSNLWSVPVPESGPVSPADAHPVTTGSQTIEGVSLSRDGEWIAFDSNQSGNQDIYRMPRRGGQAVRLTMDPHDDFAPSWSPDGKSIAFHSFRNGNRDIYVMGADGAGVQQVTSDPAHERYPAWSPDGKSLTFFSDKTGAQEVYIVTQEHGVWGKPLQVTSGKGSIFPRWSPDGQSLAYIDILNGLTLISPNGRDLTLLQPKESRGPITAIYVAWPPNSPTIYFKATERTYRGSLWSIPAAGGPPKHLVQFDDSRNSPRNEFDTDGKELFFTMTERESDIWMLELRK